MPGRNRRCPYETAGLKSGAFSCAFPFFHQTFFPAWDGWADAVLSATAPAAAIVAPLRRKFLLSEFAIPGYSKLSSRGLAAHRAFRSDVSRRTTPPIHIHPD